MELTELTLREAEALVLSRRVSPLELTQTYLTRIEQVNPQVNCFITVTAELALKQARQVEKVLSGQGNPPLLCGIPIALKDLFETQGVRTTGGSKFYIDYVPQSNAVVVEKLYQAGAILLGKLNMHEIALGVTNVNPHFGACHNPWKLEHVSGGSSGGSAAGLAARLCLGSLGSDTGGSIRIPASLCGVVGLKPTYGRVSLRGVIPLSWSLDHVGPLARQVEDAAILLQVMAGYDADDPCAANVPVDDYLANLKKGMRGWRVALARDEFFDQIDGEIFEAFQEAGEVFKSLGARIFQVPFPGAREAAQANALMVTSEAATFHQERLTSQPEDFGEDVLQRLQMGAAYSMSEYILARYTQRTMCRQFGRFFEDYDILLTPTTPITAPPIQGPDAVEQARLLTRFTAPFNLTGLPAISLPCGFSNQGLPIGLQIVSPAWSEARLLRAAYAYEQATDWHLRKPLL